MKNRTKYKMDRIPGDTDIYQEVFNQANTLTLFVLAIYLACSTIGFDLSALVSLLNIPLPIASVLLEVIMEIIGLFAIHTLLYNALLWIKEQFWIHEYKNKFLAGKWLHIHDKEDTENSLRIGVVTIKQNFHTLDVSGFNINPLVPGCGNVGRTKWSYLTSRIYPSQLSGVELFGSYVAVRENEPPKQGIHVFHDIEPDEDGFPYYLAGNFFDTFQVNDNILEDIEDRKGILYFYKLTPVLENYLYTGEKLDNDKLETILSAVVPALPEDNPLRKHMSPPQNPDMELAKQLHQEPFVRQLIRLSISNLPASNRA